MYVVKTYIDKSAIEGIGVFAAEDIPKGALVWTYVEGFDQSFDKAAVDAMPEAAQRHFRRHAWESEGKMYIGMDYGQFTNHADEPNTGPAAQGMSDIALRDIKAGEELTYDYRLFDEGHFCEEFLALKAA